MNYVKKIIVLVLGILVLSLGASILITANLGTDAVTIMNQGVSVFLNINIGWGILINNSVLFLIMLLFNRKKIHIGTVVSAALTGPAISLFMFLMPEAFSDIFIINLMFSMLALIICSFGIALYIYSNTGLGPFEGVIDIISNKIKLKFGYTKIIADVVFFITGALLGGVFHIASVISVFIVGPLIHLFMLILNKSNFIIIDKRLSTDLEPEVAA